MCFPIDFNYLKSSSVMFLCVLFKEPQKSAIDFISGGGFENRTPGDVGVTVPRSEEGRDLALGFPSTSKAILNKSSLFRISWDHLTTELADN